MPIASSLHTIQGGIEPILNAHSLQVRIVSNTLQTSVDVSKTFASAVHNCNLYMTLSTFLRPVHCAPEGEVDLCHLFLYPIAPEPLHHARP